MAEMIRSGETRRFESAKHVISISDFRGIEIVTGRYWSHPRLRFKRYYPPHYGKRQGKRPLYTFEIDLTELAVLPEDYYCFSYFTVEIGGIRYMANVSGGSNPDRTDRRPATWGGGHLQLLRRDRGGWRSLFGRRDLEDLLEALGDSRRPVRDDAAAETVATAYAREQERLAAERLANESKGLVTSAVACPDGRTFVWTTRGNFYLPPGAYRSQWQAGLIPGQSMTIEALRERGIVCTPADEEYPETVYGR